MNHVKKLNHQTKKSKITLLTITTTILLLISIITMLQPTTANDIPQVVDGRILPPRLTGDTSNWIEIATYEQYSLIVREKYLNAVFFFTDDPDLNSRPYTVQIKDYPNYMDSDSYVRNHLNYWFNDMFTANFHGGEMLPINARLRSYTVQNTATSTLGTSGQSTSLIDGFSTPISVKANMGDDVVFALSYSEVATFLSKK